MKFKALMLMFIAAFFLVAAYSVIQGVEASSAGVVLNQQTSTTTSPIATATSEITPTEAEASAGDNEEITRPSGWGKETHSNEVDPNYDVVFPQDKVNQITITIDPESWAAMQANMTDLYGEPGTRQGGPGGGGRPGGGGPGAGGPPAAPPNAEGPALPGSGNWLTMFWVWVNRWLPEGFVFWGGNEQVKDGGPMGGGPGFGGPDSARENPMWIPATLEFEGHTWTKVGVRYKGNSSLMSSWGSGSSKMPLKLDFDQFEGEYPEIKNQRFYGFKQLALSSGFHDNTYMHEAVMYDLLEEAGLVAAETAYYEVFIDHGEGPVSQGLYVVIEVVDDTVIERFFDDDSGNIYEAEGRAVSLAEGTFDQIKNSFQKENNEEEADWSDIEALYEVLHAEERTTDPAAWRARLESIFNVDVFLKWLAISAVFQHWDTYGGMSHNFYLYHDPATGQLTWISWDHNEILGGMGGPGGRQPQQQAAPTKQPTAAAAMNQPKAVAAEARKGGGGMGGHNVSLDKANVGDNWPLIRYLLDDPTYYVLYINYLKETSSGVFNPDKLAQKYQQLAQVIGPYAAKEKGKEAFEAAVQELTKRTYDRSQAVADFLATQ